MFQMNVDVLPAIFPQEILIIISNFYTDIVYTAATRIQGFFVKHIGYQCDDCGSRRRLSDLVRAHACDDWMGCCYTSVCKDACTYYCGRGHANFSACEMYFMDPPGYDDSDYTQEMYNEHNRYGSYDEECGECGWKVYVRREFTFDNYWRSRLQYYEF